MGLLLVCRSGKARFPGTGKEGVDVALNVASLQGLECCVCVVTAV